MKMHWSQISGVLGLGLAVWFVSFAPLHAATASSLGIRTINEDSFYNYDFLSQNPAANNVDWTLDMLYYNNANLAKVKGLYWPDTGGGMWGRINDGGGWLWPSDTGTKSGGCPFWGEIDHMRLYANGNNRSNNISWGYYVLGSAHLDKDECNPNRWFGWSETVEGRLAQHARDAHGLAVWEDWDNWANAEPDRWEGNHFWQNNGLATAVSVP